MPLNELSIYQRSNQYVLEDEANASTTGYYLHKFFKESWNRDKGFSISAPPVWRLPEFIYIYCEAVNETTGPNQEIYDMINGMRPVEDPNGKIVVDGKKYKMKRFCVEERVFVAPQHYLFPLMNSELQRCPTLVQNPGW